MSEDIADLYSQLCEHLSPDAIKPDSSTNDSSHSHNGFTEKISKSYTTVAFIFFLTMSTQTKHLEISKVSF